MGQTLESVVRCLFVETRPRPDLFDPVGMAGDNGQRYRPIGKPFGGLWTSPDHPRGRSAWRTWCRQEGTDFTRRLRTWRLTAVDVRVYTIDDHDDLLAALDRWPHKRYRDSPRLFCDREIDYAAMAADGYDAIHLTEEGQWRTRLSFPDNLHGWDVPTIFWLRWMFTDVSPVRRPRAPAPPPGTSPN